MDPNELPVQWANYLSMLGFLMLAVLVWLIPRERVMQDAPDEARWRDLRLWASALIVFQVCLYALFA